MKITQEIFEQYEQVRESGRVNMVNKNGVQRVAFEMDLHALVTFIEDGDYYDLLQNYGDYQERYGAEA